MQPTAPVVAAVDLSEIAPIVVQTSARLAGRLGAPLLVLHCSEALTDDEEAGALLPGLRHRMARERESVESQLLDLLRQAGLAPHPQTTIAVVAGPASEAVTERAAAEGARLVVLGAPHPHRVLESTVEKIVRRSSSPVLVVRRPPGGGYRRILVGVDFSAASQRAWEAAVSLSDEGAHLVACHVQEHVPDGDSRGRLGEWTRARPGGEAARCRVERGTPKATLLGVAGEEGADLLALGRSAHLGLTEFLLGSVAEKLAAGAPCDVLVAAGADLDDET